MERAKVPQFGNWESEEIPYTICFDNARKGKKSGQLLQNDQGNLEIQSKGNKLSSAASPKHELLSSQEEGDIRITSHSPLRPNLTVHKSSIEPSHKFHGRGQPGNIKQESEAFKALDTHGSWHDTRKIREEGDMRRFTDSPLHNEIAGRRPSSGNNTPSRVSRQSAGSNRSVEPSPLHPHSQGRVGGKNSGFSSPSWERKATSESSHSLAPSTPGRSRLRSVAKGDDTPDKSPAIPKFGEWDETNPASAEEYSHIFSRVREEKNSDTGKVPVMPTETTYSNFQKHYGNDDLKGCWCFPWGTR
ncbi:RPM1-interacting protein 4-like [Primulina huaijiensis]|uniref:RPM1-interacting protein 4-like n=1 Tax=Primulina huaijiensis TaxID=1492673 RepID=UPI003CC79B8B